MSWHAEPTFGLFYFLRLFSNYSLFNWRVFGLSIHRVFCIYKRWEKFSQVVSNHYPTNTDLPVYFHRQPNPYQNFDLVPKNKMSVLATLPKLKYLHVFNACAHYLEIRYRFYWYWNSDFQNDGANTDFYKRISSSFIFCSTGSLNFFLCKVS